MEKSERRLSWKQQQQEHQAHTIIIVIEAQEIIVIS
jgi:hypothetical protein